MFPTRYSPVLGMRLRDQRAETRNFEARTLARLRNQAASYRDRGLDKAAASVEATLAKTIRIFAGELI